MLTDADTVHPRLDPCGTVSDNVHPETVATLSSPRCAFFALQDTRAEETYLLLSKYNPYCRAGFLIKGFLVGETLGLLKSSSMLVYVALSRERHFEHSVSCYIPKSQVSISPGKGYMSIPTGGI